MCQACDFNYNILECFRIFWKVLKFSEVFHNILEYSVDLENPTIFLDNIF